MNDDENIRPSLKLAAVLVILAAAALVAWVVSAPFDSDRTERGGGRTEGDPLAWFEPDAGPGIAARRVGPSEPVRADDPRVTGEEPEWTGEGRPRPRPRARDPQLERSLASLRHAPDAGLGLFDTMERTGRVTSISGDAPIGVGAMCSVRVLPVLTSRFNCMVRVICDGVLLYPDPSEDAGYVDCRVVDGVPATAHDHMATYQDTDPKVRIDMMQSKIEVGDDSPEGGTYLASISLDTRRPLRL